MTANQPASQWERESRRSLQSRGVGSWGSSSADRSMESATLPAAPLSPRRERRSGSATPPVRPLPSRSWRSSSRGLAQQLPAMLLVLALERCRYRAAVGVAALLRPPLGPPRRGVGRSAPVVVAVRAEGVVPVLRAAADGGGSLKRRHSTAGSSRCFSTARGSVPSASAASEGGDAAAGDDDTVFALSSGSTAGAVATAVAVVRITGPRVVSHVIPRLLSPSTARRVLRSPRTAVVGTLADPDDGSPLDQAVVIHFPRPKSFTGEDVLEVHAHGSRAVLRDLFEALQSHHCQCRIAEPGEFTQRAFGAGKLDVLQVEALADLLASDTARQRRQALRQLEGELSQAYVAWRDELIAGLAHAEAVIDFGDDERLDDDEDASVSNGDGGAAVWGGVVERMLRLQRSMEYQLGDARRGELVRDGLRVAVVGPVNAGKSSLFNALARRDAAIVSSQAGTTRDVLEVALNLGGVKCLLQDTAGVRDDATDDVELQGIQRTTRAAAQADVIVAMVDLTDAAAGLQSVQGVLRQTTAIYTSAEEDERAGRPATPVILVVNKVDLASPDPKEPNGAASTSVLSSMEDEILPKTSESGQSHQHLVSAGAFEVSCLTQQGLDDFLRHLTATVVERVSASGEADTTAAEAPSDESVLITRARHRQHVAAAAACLERFRHLALQGGMAADMAAEELRLAASELGRVTGAVDVEDVLDKLFADFCIGK